MPITMDRSPDDASIESTIALCREACFDGEPDGSGDYGTVCSNRKVIELCESVLALRAALARAEAERDLRESERDESEHSRQINHIAAKAALDQRDAAVAAMRDFTVCFHCGWCGPNADAEAHGAVCEKHPQRKVEAERDALRLTLEQHRERCQQECINGGRTGAPELALDLSFLWVNKSTTNKEATE